MMFRTTFSSGSPSFSYIASRNAGSATAIIKNMAPVLPMELRASRWDAHRRRDAEAHKLAFRQIKGKFGLDL